MKGAPLNITISDDEITDLLEQVKMRYGYDFLNYSKASLKRRIQRFAENNRFDNFFDLKHRIINSKGFFGGFVAEIMVNVTEMFRDPDSLVSLQQHVFPFLYTYPVIKIWHAGCASGEEVYSNVILLKENKLLKKTKIYATDLSQPAIQYAQNGSYPLKFILEYEKNYIHSGGKNTLLSYFKINHDTAHINPLLKTNIIFSLQNLATDSSFNEFNLIVCKNVLIYFNRELQNRVIELFYDSLCMFGYLALGSKESLVGSRLKDKFELIDRKAKIYRKIG